MQFKTNLMFSQVCFTYFVIQILKPIHQGLYTDVFIKIVIHFAYIFNQKVSKWNHKESCVILDQCYPSDLRFPVLFVINLLKETEGNNRITEWLEGTLKIIQF